jgi:ABC-type methionine transport system ATPase subunit
VKKVVELNIPSKLKNEPIIYTIYKEFDVVPNIIEASFSSENGWAILSLEGNVRELERLFKYLKNKEIEIRER